MMVLMIVSNFRIQAVMATLKGFPAAFSLSNNCFMTGLYHFADKTAIAEDDEEQGLVPQ
ncbi:MAG: hypothetical protein LBH14_04375 [Desulfobulbaceae bacterium]|jgi:hypothetical protein|nr:hypothetical protein [Desulfobulbaceae bacterium]